jgi:MFS family permease
MSMMQVMYEPKERAGVMGLFGMLGGLGASLGPVIGGLLIKANLFNWDWRPIFLINLPVGIFALIAGMKYLPDGKSIHPLHIDVKGTLLIVAALGLMVFPLIEGRDLNWPIWALIMLGLSIPAIMLFGWYEIRKDKRDKSALIVPALFKLKSFVSGLGLNIIVESIMIGYFLTVTLVMQIGLGYSPIKAALTGVPTAIGMGIGFAVLGNRFVAKFGRMAINIGVLFFATGLIATTWVITHFNIQAHPWQFIPGLFIIGIGLSQIMVPIFSAALQDVDPNHAGSASGILNAVQQVGGAVGVAIIGVIFFGQLTHGAYTSFDSVKPDLEKQLTAQAVPADIQKKIVSQARTCYHDRATEKDTNVVPASCQAAQKSVPEGIAFREKLTDIVTASSLKANAINFANAFRTGAIYVLLLLILVCGLSFMLPKKLHVSEEGMGA